MLYAQKANVVTKITEEQVDKFVADGYRIIDEAGSLVKETAPTSIPALQQAYLDSVAEINVLKDEISKLKADLITANKLLKAKEAEEKKTEVKQVEEAEVAEEVKPKRTRKKASEE